MKRKILLILLTLLAVCISLTACDGNQAKKVSALTVVEGTLATEYEVGDIPDFSGLKAVVTYDDGSAETVGSDKLTIGTLDTSSAGTKKLSVKFGKFEIEVEITVKEKSNEPTVTKIEIVESTLSSVAFVGGVYDASAIQVVATYSDKTEKIFGINDVEIILPDTTEPGEKTLTVKYGELTDTFTVTVSAVSGIKVVADSLKNEVFVGDELNTEGLSVIVSYTNAPDAIKSAEELVIGTVDTSTHGEKMLSITYNGFTVEYKITVVDIESVSINTASVAAKVKVMSPLDVSKITATVTYTNGKTQTVSAAELTVENINTSSAGVKTLKAKYKDAEGTLDITVVGVESITVISGTLESEALVGSTFKTDAAQISVLYTDGTTEIVGQDRLNIGKLDTSEAGDKKVTVNFLDGAINFAVKVCGVESIRVEGVPKSVPAGEKPDLSAMKVYEVYGDSKKTAVLITEGYTHNADSLDFNVEGAKIITVTYGEFTANVVISATDPELDRIEILTYDKAVGIKRAYNKGSVTVIAYYGNDTSDVIKEGFTVSDISTLEAGAQTLTVSYTEGGITKEATAEVKVLPVKSITVSGLAELIELGEALVTDSVKLTVTYSDGESELSGVVDMNSDVVIGEFDNSKAGDVEIAVSYLGTTAMHKLHIRGIVSIEIMKGSVDDVVRAGYDVATDRLELRITYTNGAETVKFSALEGAECKSESTAEDKQTFTVTYNGLTDSCEISVLRLVSVSALNGTVPVSVVKDYAFPYSQIRLTAIYENTEGEEFVYLVGVDDKNLSLSDFSTATAGEKALVFSYMGMETSVRIMVNGIEGLTLVPGSIQTVLSVGQELDTTELRVRLQYTDGTYIFIDTTSIYLTIGSIDTSTEGTKILKIKYQETELDVEISVKNVTVGQDEMIFGVTLPNSLVARESYKKNFKDSTAPYVVGSNNPYIFYLNIIVLDDNFEIVDVDGRTYKSVVRVFKGVPTRNEETGEYTGTELTGDELAAIVSVDAENNSYQFTDAAVGGTYTLVVRPDGECADIAACTRIQTVTVVDAYNVYTAKELNVMTNVDADLNGGIGGHFSQLEAVNRFLADNGITRPENLKGVVIHNNIDVKVEDIPEEYIFEGKGFYDHLSVFYHQNTAENKHFTLYGNYYSIYSYNLPCVVENGVANNDDPYSSSELIRLGTSEALYSESFNHKDYSTDIVNIAFRDNDPNSNDQAASERHMRGLICLKLNTQIVNITNTNIDAFIISVVPEHDDLTLNINKSKFYNAWQGHLFVWNNNLVQDKYGGEDTAPRAGYEKIKINITESLLAKCGGPVILSQSTNMDHKCNASTGADIVVDSASELYSYVTGQEAWFIAVGHSTTAAQIVGLNYFINMAAQQQNKSASFTSTEKIAGVTAVNMIMVNMGEGGALNTGEDYDGTYTVNGLTTLNMTDNPMVDLYNSNVGGAPVFQSSAGGTCFTDGVTGTYGIETGGPGPATENCFEGDYITIYYMGMAILLEYYH